MKRTDLKAPAPLLGPGMVIQFTTDPETPVLVVHSSGDTATASCWEFEGWEEHKVAPAQQRFYDRHQERVDDWWGKCREGVPGYM